MRMKTIVAMILAALICVMNVVAIAETYPCEGVANTLSVRVRKKTTTSSAQVTTLDRGEVVTVLEAVTKKNGDVWYRVETSKGRKGYVLSDYLSVPEVERIEGAQNSPDAVMMKLTVWASSNDYNSVGEKWTQYYEWNGVQAKAGQMEAWVAPEVELSVYARIREQDQKPDTAMEKTLYVPTAEEVAAGFRVTQNLKITENGGKYRGNSCVWTVVFAFEPMGDMQSEEADGLKTE